MRAGPAASVSMSSGGLALLAEGGGLGGVHVAVSLGLFIDRVLARGFSGLPASGFLVSG